MKHFGVRNNTEKGKGELTCTNCSKFVARIVAEQVLIAITKFNANESIELEYYR